MHDTCMQGGGIGRGSGGGAGAGAQELFGVEPDQPEKAGGEGVLEAGIGQALHDLSGDVPASCQGHHFTAPLREVLLLQRVEHPSAGPQ